MKKKTLNRKLLLNKETIAQLNDEQMNAVNGGASEAFCGTSAHAFTCGCVPATGGGTCAAYTCTQTGPGVPNTVTSNSGC